MKITALEPHPRRPDWWIISLDNAPDFALDGAVVVARNLTPGRDLADTELAELLALVAERELLEAALVYLAVRPRSRSEMRRRLMRRRPHTPPPEPEVVERVLSQLEARRLLNDGAFASYWVEQRERFSPRGARALTQELRQRGVDRETAAAAADPERDDERALAAGRVRARVLRASDYLSFKNKLGPYLIRRGFSYGTARDVVRQLWDERAAQDNGDDASDDDTGEVDMAW